jgi:Zn-dependent peptidase ImmA (M78 family)
MTRINPEMLILAREARGLSQRDVATILKVQQGTVSKWESGLMQPNEQAIEMLSQEMALTEEFFFQTEHRVFGFNSSVFFHRKQQSFPEKALKKLHARMNIVRFRLSRLLRSIEISSTAKFQRIDPAEYLGRPDTVAAIVRSAWMLPPGPVRGVITAIEEAGGVVMNFDFGTRQIDAISEWIPPYPPIFLVNSNSEISTDRLRLTLAHEIGHVVMHRFPHPKIEDEANVFACEFLMPRKEIKPALYRLTIPKLMDLKSIWKVSMAALIMHACRIGTISESRRRYLLIQLHHQGYRMKEPLEEEMPVERPSVFDNLVKLHLNDLGYSPSQLARLLFYRDESEFSGDILDRTRIRLVG